ncbi:MAG: hypothetical protein FWC34_11040 [Bacteroidetes bacterium]|nr:hypothetical protein [Bacteroidota bacterium]MCL2302923.1 hypothetical protein [Lentimicrobiaceae bacterium]
MKDIFLSIQGELSKIPELKHIDKNWGQLLYEQPPVKFPCALLDIAEVDYGQLGMLAQDADGAIEITIANAKNTRSSHKAPRKEDSYAIFDIVNKIHDSLHGYTNGELQPLIRVKLKKIDAAAGYEIYRVVYVSGWREHKKTNTIPVQVTPKIIVEIE